MRRGGLVILVVALALAAGCSALGGSSGPDGPMPPGVADNGSVNETKLQKTHVAAANGTTVKVTHRNGDRRTVAYRGPNASFVRDEDGATYAMGPVSVSNETFGGADYEFDFARNSSFDFGDATAPVRFARNVRLGTAEYEHAGTRTVDGTDLHELELVDTTSLGNALGHYTGTILVDEQGRIHSLSGEVGENKSVADEYEFTYDWGVETVPEPSWLDSVPRGEARKTASGTAFAFELTGGPSVPAGTELTFAHDGETHRMTLNESLAPGETLALGLRDANDGRTLAVSRGSLDGAALVDLRGKRTQLSGTVTLDDGTTVSVTVSIGYIDI